MDEDRWLDDREQRAWRGLLGMHADLSQYVERQLRVRHGLSQADYEVLVLLSESSSGRLRAFEIGQALRWEKSRLSQHLTRMEGRALVRRERCPTDQRGTFVALTDRGRELIRAAAGPHVADVRALLLDHVTEEQLDVLAELADLVRDRVAALEQQALSRTTTPDRGTSGT
jgi:DNA-binding MarR family transcriptional regulator